MINDKGGAFNALANYWFTRFEYDASGEQRAVPEYNLESGGAQGPIAKWCERHGATDDDASTISCAFEAGLHFAAVLVQQPFDEQQLRKAVADFVKMNPERFLNTAAPTETK
jgi:hypothetical protein